MTEKQYISDKDDTALLCADMVVEGDYDRYLTTLFVSSVMRRHLLALYAFNIEVARALENTREPMISEIRLQWWRETLVAIEQGTVRKHPVAIELAPLIQGGKVLVTDMITIIDARSDELNNQGSKTLEELIDYSKRTAGTLNRLAFQVLYGAADTEVMKKAEGVGIAWGLVGVIRAISFHAASQRCLIPDALLEKASINPEDLYKGEFSSALDDVVKEIAEKAEAILDDSLKGLRKEYVRAFLLTSLNKSYLNQLKSAAYDIKAVDFSRKKISRLTRLTWSALCAAL